MHATWERNRFHDIGQLGKPLIHLNFTPTIHTHHKTRHHHSCPSLFLRRAWLDLVSWKYNGIQEPRTLNSPMDCSRPSAHDNICSTRPLILHMVNSHCYHASCIWEQQQGGHSGHQQCPLTVTCMYICLHSKLNCCHSPTKFDQTHACFLPQ